MIKFYHVSEIGKDAFFGCSSLVQVSIPSSVTFGEDTFFAKRIIVENNNSCLFEYTKSWNRQKSQGKNYMNKYYLYFKNHSI